MLPLLKALPTYSLICKRAPELFAKAIYSTRREKWLKFFNHERKQYLYILLNECLGKVGYLLDEDFRDFIWIGP